MTNGMDALVQPMLSVAIFQGASWEQLAAIARSAERIVYRPGDTIVQADTEGDAAVLIVAGDAVLVSGQGVDGDIEEVAEGSLVAEMAMLVEVEHASTVIARGQVRALRITREGLSELLEKDQALAGHFLDKVASRLSDFARDMRGVDGMLGGIVTSCDAASAVTAPAALH